MLCWSKMTLVTLKILVGLPASDQVGLLTVMQYEIKRINIYHHYHRLNTGVKEEDEEEESVRGLI